jgi:hypothetical protein
MDTGLIWSYYSTVFKQVKAENEKREGKFKLQLLWTGPAVRR